MARVDEAVHIETDPDTVWSVLIDWESQPQWMVDARSAVVLSPEREGTGVVVRCRTNILAGVVITDDITVTEWEPSQVLGVRHLGPWFQGVGAFELQPTDDGTYVRWWEEVEPPLGRVGEVAATVFMPRVGRVFRRSLAALKEACETR